MRRARKMWTQIAKEQAQLEAIGRLEKKRTINSEPQVARGNEEKVRISDLLGWLTTLSSCATKLSVPSPAAARFSTVHTASWVLPAADFPESALWLNVGGQMVVDPHDRALK